MMPNMKHLVSMLYNAVLNGKGIDIHKKKEFPKNCILVESVTDIPPALLMDGAIGITPGDVIVLRSVKGSVSRKLPVVIRFEEVSPENEDKVPGKFAAWPKDNGFDTTKVVDGKCYNLPSTVKASLITEKVPDWVKNAGFPVNRKGDCFELTRTDWGGEVRTGPIGKAMWVQYTEKDINILNLAEQSASEYIVSYNGEDVGVLTEILADLI